MRMTEPSSQGLANHDHSAGQGGSLAAGLVTRANLAASGAPQIQVSSGSASISTEADVATITPTNLPCSLIVVARAPAAGVGEGSTILITDNANTALATGGFIRHEASTISHAVDSLTSTSANNTLQAVTMIARIASGVATPVKVRASYPSATQTCAAEMVVVN